MARVSWSGSASEAAPVPTERAGGIASRRALGEVAVRKGPVPRRIAVPRSEGVLVAGVSASGKSRLIESERDAHDLGLIDHPVLTRGQLAGSRVLPIRRRGTVVIHDAFRDTTDHARQPALRLLRRCRRVRLVLVAPSPEVLLERVASRAARDAADGRPWSAMKAEKYGRYQRAGWLLDRYVEFLAAVGTVPASRIHLVDETGIRALRGIGEARAVVTARYGTG